MSGISYIPKAPDVQSLSLFRHDVFVRMRQAQASAPDSPLKRFFTFAPIPEMSAVVGQQAEVINGQAVSGGYYTGLGVQPMFGRAITEEDDRPGSSPVVVLSHQYWQERSPLSGKPICLRCVGKGKSSAQNIPNLSSLSP